MNRLLGIKNLFRGFYIVLKGTDLDINPVMFILKYGHYQLLGKQISAHHNTIILGLRNIETHGRLYIGTRRVSFLHKHDRTFLNIEGKLVVAGDVEIGKGCRLVIEKGAVCTLERCRITGLSNFIISHSLEVGEGTLIAWGCEFLDGDRHTIEYEGKQEKEPGITIGRHVWIGSNVRILKGVHIPDNSVVAANSVVTKPFEEENVLIAGNPARIVTKGILWK